MGAILHSRRLESLLVLTMTNPGGTVTLPGGGSVTIKPNPVPFNPFQQTKDYWVAKLGKGSSLRDRTIKFLVTDNPQPTPSLESQYKSWLNGKSASDLYDYYASRIAVEYGHTQSIPDQIKNLNPLSSLTDFLNLLTNPHFWVRVAEVLLGAGLVLIAAAHMSSSAKQTIQTIPVARRLV